MKTDELEKCIHVIGYWLNEDETVIDKVVHNEKKFVKEFIVPYSKELNINLLLKESNEGKKDLIKFYIFELWELQGFFGYNKNTIEHKPNKKGVVMLKNVDEVKTDYEKYVILCYSYFNLIVEELQLCCGKYNIDFWGICNELGFSTDNFDNGITMIFEEIKNEKSQSQKAKTEQETPTFTNNFDNIKPIEIYKHFKTGLVDKGYLTIEELNKYLKAAFELKTKPETLFKLKHTPTKQKIYTVFYIYYKDIAQKKHERQKEYAALLGDFFEGYKNETIQTNWARDYKTKR